MVSVDVDESMPWQKACNFLDFVSFNTPQVRRTQQLKKIWEGRVRPCQCPCMHSFFSLEHSEETWNFKNALKLPSLVSPPPTLPPGQLPLSSRGSLSVYRVYQLEKSLDKRQAKSNPSELNGTEDHGSTWVQCDQRWSFHSFDGIMEWKLLSSTLHLKEPLGSSMTPSSAWHFRKTTTNPNRDVFLGIPPPNGHWLPRLHPHPRHRFRSR